MGFTGFYWVLLGFIGLVRGSTGFYWVTANLYLVALDLTRFLFGLTLFWFWFLPCFPRVFTGFFFYRVSTWVRTGLCWPPCRLPFDGRSSRLFHFLPIFCFLLFLCVVAALRGARGVRVLAGRWPEGKTSQNLIETHAKPIETHAKPIETQ